MESLNNTIPSHQLIGIATPDVDTEDWIVMVLVPNEDSWSKEKWLHQSVWLLAQATEQANEMLQQVYSDTTEVTNDDHTGVQDSGRDAGPNQQDGRL